MKILDQGYLEFIESWGSDERIVEAARMSTGKGFNGWGPLECPSCEGKSPNATQMAAQYAATGDTSGACDRCNNTHEVPGDEKLLQFLWDKKHATPFEMAGMVLEVKAPLMVFREWHRHRTQSYNEMSARYIPLPDEDYLPTARRVLLANNATTNKQAQGTVKGKILTEVDALAWLERLGRTYDEIQRTYEFGLALGIPKELARLPVSVGRYSRMRVSANLRNWLGFMALRCDTAAQWEIREYANAAAQTMRERFPRVYAVAQESLRLPA